MNNHPPNNSLQLWTLGERATPSVDSSDLILTLAEVSIAYVGFAAIFGILSTRTSVWSPELRIMFRALIEVGIFSLYLSIIPHTLNTLGVVGHYLWMYSSVAALVGGVPMGAARMYLIRTRLDKVPSVGKLLLIPLMLVTIVLFLTNALVRQQPGPYVLGIVLALATGSGIFLSLIYRLFPIHRSTSDE